MKTALFAGSFDPVTLGHWDIVSRATGLFDSIVMGVGLNSDKKGTFTPDQKVTLLKKTFENFPSVRVETFEGLTIDFAKKIGAEFLLRGLRNANDLEYEKSIATVNRKISGGIETIFLVSSVEYSHISSSLVREVLHYKADPSSLLPPAIIEDILNMLKK